MMELINVSLRQQAVFIPNTKLTAKVRQMRESTAGLVANLAKLGYGVSEDLLHALNQTTPKFQVELLEKFRVVMGVNKNWTPLVKGWDTPTGETVVDHLMTFFANVFQARGVRLQCGHIIPAGTFPLERYNGCPFCGTPFEQGQLEHTGQGSKLKVLELWTEAELHQFFSDLLSSKTALDATQIDSLKILLKALPLPQTEIAMKETLMTVIDLLVAQGEAQKASALFKSPTDILRYLWYKHTGFLQIIEPKTIVRRKMKNNRHLRVSLDKSAQARLAATEGLKLKYGRKDGYIVATWLNALPLPSEKICEMMHPKRNMWVRFIRALRLAEYSRRREFGKLREIMDIFYNQRYRVWQGQVEHYRLRSDFEQTMRLLKQRPGLFARSLFANMLWFGAEDTANAFAEVIDKVPARLVLTLNMYAQNYFTRHNRSVKPLGGVRKTIPPNQLLSIYNDEQLQEMQGKVEDLCVLAMRQRFAAQKNTHQSIYIDPLLYKIPLAIGERSDNVQDLPSALMGMRFPLEGNTVRLFMQWGEGLPAQHLDMDLSCYLAYQNGNSEYCSYSNLTATGCQHSGDIRSIPNKVGTAEYIDVDVVALRKAGVKYVSFACNAYSNGAITPNLVVGWMDSRYPMKISEKTGVAYDPSCVQQQVRITSSVTKGLVFGVLDVEANEVVWLEMAFGGQVVQGLNLKGVETLLAKLDSRLSIGNLLALKAEAQGLTLQEETSQADEVYDQKWARNTAAVTKLLVG